MFPTCFKTVFADVDGYKVTKIQNLAVAVTWGGRKSPNVDSIWQRQNFRVWAAVLFSYMLLSLQATPNAQAQSATSSGGGAQNKVAALQTARLPPQFRLYASALGNRLVVTGEERVTLSGVLTYAAGGYSSTSVLITLETPDKFRLSGGPSQLVVFDGTAVQTKSGGPTSADSNLMDTFFTDFADQFLLGYAQGAPARELVRHALFSKSGQPVSPPTYYNVFELTQQDLARSNKPILRKLFYFNSVTQLLERVVYADPNAPQQQITTVYSAWQQIQSQQLPTHIERFENGTKVLDFQLASGAIAAAAADGLFGQF
jgi:hypothetical protein